MLIHYKALSLCAVVATSALGLLASAPAHAQSDDIFVITAPRTADIPVRRVSYRDLNLTYAPHRVVLIHRVDRAVNQVCTASGFVVDISIKSWSERRACRDVAWNGARPQLAAAINRAWARAARAG